MIKFLNIPFLPVYIVLYNTGTTGRSESRAADTGNLVCGLKQREA